MLILVRHGQTASNASGLLLGRDDPPLNELGRQQAKALAAVHGVAGAARVIASPLRRARETAEMRTPSRNCARALRHSATSMSMICCEEPSQNNCPRVFS